MKKLLLLLQFLPLSVFMGVARSKNFAPDAWPMAFQWGAFAGALQLTILLPILGNRLSRLITGANTFLIFGGIAFYFDVQIFLNLISYLREAGVIFFVGIVCIFSTLFTQSGVFEVNGPDKKYSYYFLIGIVVALGWSISQRGNTLLGGVIPFVSLIILKQYLQRRTV